MDQFFHSAEEEQQRVFIDKYDKCFFLIQFAGLDFPYLLRVCIGRILISYLDLFIYLFIYLFSGITLILCMISRSLDGLNG